MGFRRAESKVSSAGALIALCCVTALAADARAQGIASSFTELRLLVRPGDRISVTASDGAELTGRLARLSPSALTLTVGGRTRDFQEADVTTIQQRRPDSLGNGALIGMGVGGGLVFVAGAVSGGFESDEAGWLVLGTLAWAGVGSAIGVGIDALITSPTVIYERPARQGARLRVSPILTRARRGVRASIRF
jgi:hypothetical protein